MVGGGLGLVNLWEARVEAVFLLWPTVFPSVLYIECRPKRHTVGQKFPEIDLLYISILFAVFGFEGRQPSP